MLDWMTKESRALAEKYTQAGDGSIEGMYRRLASYGASFYESILDEAAAAQLESAFADMFLSGYFSPATPVATNFRPNTKLTPVSCFGLKPANSIDGIFTTSHEAAMLSKNGGGLGICLDDLIGISPVTHWARVFDVTAATVSQGSTRRGSVALYLDIRHPDIKAFLHSKNLQEGDHRSKLDCNIAVSIDDKFMEQLKAGEADAVELFTEVLKLRMRTGSPYIFFRDNANKALPTEYEEYGLKISSSQLCAEIMQYSSPDETYTCVLSSLNLATYGKWAYKAYSVAGFTLTVPMLGIWFLDAVCQDFINKAEGRPGMVNARRSAIKNRALGMGVLGLHAFLQQQQLSYEDGSVPMFLESIFGKIRTEAEESTNLLGSLLSPPELCKTTRRRNVLLMAIAPTLSNSTLCCPGSPGIEPIASNYYAFASSNSTFIRKNPRCKMMLASYGLDNDETWAIIRNNDGSVASLPIGERDKSVFATAREINQLAYLKVVAAIQTYVDQGISTNLFIPHNEDAKLIWQYHIAAWKLGLKSLYYVRSTSGLNTVVQPTMNEDVPALPILYTREGCTHCLMAKQALVANGINYVEEHKQEGNVPMLSVGHAQLIGSTSIEQYAREHSLTASDCGCDG